MAERKPARKKTGRRKKSAAEPRTRGLSPAQVTGGPVPARLAELSAAVEEDGGAVIGSYRDPLGGHWQLLVALPIERVQPTPFQRDISQAHVERLGAALGALDRFLDPIIAVRKEGGAYWTPNGHHRLAALRDLGAKSITALLVPEADLAYRILSLNTEKAHNLRERSLEAIRMAHDLARIDPAPETDYAVIFEDPTFLTLGLCYERSARFPGSVYQPVLKRVESFLASKLPRALEIRAERAAAIAALEELVNAAVARLKERGFESPYLKNFVVARINPLRFARGKTADFDETIEKMHRGAERFDAAKIGAKDLARTGGPSEEAAGT